MDLELVYKKVLFFYKNCKIQKLPIDCFEILHQYGYRTKKYSDLSQKKKEACLKLSKDACLIGKTLYYEDKNIWERTRFSIMHELGHIALCTDNEDDADYFASHILAPRILIHKFRCSTADDIHDKFGMSYAASNRALISYKEWFREISHRIPRQPSEPELQLEQLFFPQEVLVQHIQDDECETEFDPVDKYLYILRVLKAGLPLPAEYRSTAELYRKMGLRLK